MQVLSRPRSDNAKHFLCALTTVRVVEMWHHAFEKSESDDDIEFRALDTVNSGDGYAHSILEDLLEEAQLAIASTPSATSLAMRASELSKNA